MDKKNIITAYWSLAAVEGLITAFLLLQTQSETENNFLYGYSFLRLAMVVIVLLAVCFFSVLALSVFRRFSCSGKVKSFFTRKNKAPLTFFFAFLAGLLLCILIFLVPNYRFGMYEDYMIQIRPVFIWGLLFSIETMLVIAFINKKDLPRLVFGRQYKDFLLVVGSVFFLFLLLWFFITRTGFGIIPDDRYWNEAGVPLLNEQIFIALVTAVIFFLFSSSILGKTQNYPFIPFILKRRDYIIFIALWAIAATLWINEPLPKNFFAPGPYLPNYELSPYADAAIYDIYGQFSLIGQGIANSAFYDRALLPGILAIFHLIVGQNYLTVITLQSFLFASFIPILYLIGKSLHSRVAGIFIAVLATFKVLNAIKSSTYILSVHPKFMLTEFAASILIVLITLWFIRWLKEISSFRHLVLIGGALGVGIMLRANLFLFFPLAGILISLKFSKDWKKILQSGIILILAFFVTISPWMWRNHKVANNPFFFLPGFQAVIDTRYSLEQPEDRTVARLEDTSTLHLDLGVMPERQQIARQRTPSDNAFVTVSLQKNQPENRLTFIPNHFFHNLVTSVLSLPTSILWHDLKHTINDAFPYWNKVDGAWRGELSNHAKIGVFWNLFLLALGLGSAWKKWRITGLLPLFIFLTYHLSNAFARTSGGRYLVPTDWVVLLYYAIGIAQILFFIAFFFGYNAEGIEENICKDNVPFSARGILYILPFVLLIAGITTIDQVIPPRYEEYTPEYVQKKILLEMGIFEEDLALFFSNSNARLFLGRSLYPRFYRSGKGEHSAGKDAFEDQNFPRLSFTMIGEFGQTGVVLPLDTSPAYFPNTADVILLGCQHPREGYLYPYVDALVVIVLDDAQDIVYTRNPNAPLQCPVLEPIVQSVQ